MKKKCFSQFVCLLIFYFLIFISCTKQQNEIEFRVKKTLLAKQYNFKSINFSFCPPIACQEISDSLTSKVTEFLNEKISSSNSYKIIPRKIFFNQQDKFFCSVSEIHDFPFEERAVKDYQKLLKENHLNAEIRQTQFYYQGFEIYQSLIMDKEIVQFKLFIPQSENKSFQLDYIVPQENYVKYMEAIESSIGTIKKNN